MRDQEKKIADAVEKHGEGHSPSWIAQKVGCTRSAAYYHMTKLGYWPCYNTKGGGRGNPFTPAEDARIQKMRLGGLSPTEIGRALGRREPSVRIRLYYLASAEDRQQ